MDQITTRIRKTRALQIAGAILAAAAFLTTVLALSTCFTKWLWAVACALLFLGLLAWLLHGTRAARIWGFLGIETKISKDRSAYFLQLAVPGGPTEEEVTRATNQGETAQDSLIRRHREVLGSMLQHFENMEQHRLTRMHLFCLAGAMITLASALALHVPMRLLSHTGLNVRPDGHAPDTSTRNLVRPSENPPAVARGVAETLPDPKLTTHDGNPGVEIPNGTKPKEGSGELLGREKGLNDRLGEFGKGVADYSDKLDKSSDKEALKVQQKKLTDEGKALAQNYRALAVDAEKAGMPDLGQRAKDNAAKTDDLAKSVETETHPEKDDPKERKSDKFKEDLKKFLEWLRDILKLAKEIMDAFNSVFGEEDESSGSGTPGKDGSSKDGSSKDGSSKDGSSKDGSSKDGSSKDGSSKDDGKQPSASPPQTRATTRPTTLSFPKAGEGGPNIPKDTGEKKKNASEAGALKTGSKGTTPVRPEEN